MATIPPTLQTVTALVNVATELQGVGEPDGEAVERAANMLGIGDCDDALGLKQVATDQMGIIVGQYTERHA